MSALRVTYLTLPDQAGGLLLNVGDRVIYRGVRNIMHAAIGPHHETIRYLSDREPLPADTDIAIICGTPQILNSGTVSRNVERIAEVAESDVPVKINLGAGAFYFDAFGEDRPAADRAFAERVQGAGSAGYYRRYGGFDLVTCRDMAGDAVFNTLGIAHQPMPCPGFFSALFEPRPLFRRKEQLVSVLNGTASFWNRVDADVHLFLRQLHEADPSRIFIAHDEQDMQMLDELDIPHVEFGDADSFIRYLATAESLISLRVHGALPAWTLGLDVTLLGIDRRALLGEDFGAHFNVVPLRKDADFASVLKPGLGRPRQTDEERRAWLARHLGRYVSLIRDTVRGKLGAEPPPGVPLHGGGLPEPAVPEKRPSQGRYFRSLFHSQKPDFPVETELLRSGQAHQRENGALVVTLSDKVTIAFGPYIRIPRGAWLLRARLTFEAVPPAPEPPENSILPVPPRAKMFDIKIMKGVPGRELARVTVPVAELKPGAEMTLELPFENPSDTGELETVFQIRGGPLEGAVVRIQPLRLLRREAALAG